MGVYPDYLLGEHDLSAKLLPSQLINLSHIVYQAFEAIDGHGNLNESLLEKHLPDRDGWPKGE